MVRYRSEEKLTEKQSIMHLGSKTNLTYGQKQVTLNAKSYEQENESKQKLKMKLVVYQKDDKSYIEHSAAFALKLINTRAIMLDDSKLVEIDEETLSRLEDNEDIEIEYRDFDDKDRVQDNESDLSTSLKRLEAEEYGIGVHGIDKGNREQKLDTASSIEENGLIMNNNSRTILSTTISLGTNKDMQEIEEGIRGYQMGTGTKVNIIIAVPQYIQNQDGEKIFLGFPSENNVTSGQQYEEHCIFDRICSQMGKIPPEFILGYYEEENGQGRFVDNPNHYINISEEDRGQLYEQMSSNMDDISKILNSLIQEKKIEKLIEMKEKMKNSGMNTEMIENCIELAENNSMNNEEQEKPDEEFEKSETSESPTKKTRNILLGIFEETTISDLENGKKDLSKGLEAERGIVITKGEIEHE